tara:strand:- start:4616 stop:4858 length:243 start_codon:yes stop_codon:yes gene_type:complete
MLFQKHTGRVVVLNRFDYVNDVEYYTAILRTKGVQIKATSEPDTRVLAALKNKMAASNTNTNTKTKTKTNTKSNSHLRNK